MIFLDLILAHLLGDFVFQSNDLIQKKYKSWTGTFQHVCIIIAFTIIALLPYLHHKEAWMVIGTIFCVHFVQDCLKIQWDLNYNKKKSTLPFFVDQILHITLIYFLSPKLEGLSTFSIPSWMNTLYTSEAFAIYFMGLILFSYTYDITLYQFVRQKSKKPIDYSPNFRGMGIRIGVFTLIYIPTLLFMSGGFM